VEANIGRSSAKVLTEHAVLVVSCFTLAPTWRPSRPGTFTVLDLHRDRMDVLLLGWELPWVPDSGRRLAGWCCC